MDAMWDGHCWTCTDGRRAAPSDFAQMTAATTYARNEQVKGSIPYRTATDLSNSRLTVPSTDQHSRRGAGRKGAYRRRDAINATELAVR
jgi:hypothetical protein